jgi:hypothetical protein
MSHLQRSYLPFLPHSSTFWRSTESKSRWPAGEQHGRALERRWRAGCSTGLGCAARRAQGAAPASASVRARSPPPRGQGRWSPSRLPSLERERIFVPRCTTAAHCPAVRRPTPAARAYRGRRRAGELRRRVPSLRFPIKAAHRSALHRPQHTPAALPARPTEEPLFRPVRRRPTPLAASP